MSKSKSKWTVVKYEKFVGWKVPHALGTDIIEIRSRIGPFLRPGYSVSGRVHVTSFANWPRFHLSNNASTSSSLSAWHRDRWNFNLKFSATLRNLLAFSNWQFRNILMAEELDEALTEVGWTSCRYFNVGANNHQRLKSALWFSIGKIVDEECIRHNVNATPQFIGALTEMVWTQIGISWTPYSSPFLTLLLIPFHHLIMIS